LGRKTRRAREINSVVEPNGPGKRQRYCQRRICGSRDNDAGHRLVGKQGITSSNRTLSITPRIPRKTHARLKVLVVLFVHVSDICADLNKRGARRIEYDEPVVALSRRHIPFVTKTKLERQVRPKLVVVLHEKTERAFCDAARLIAKSHAKRRCVSGDERIH